MGPFALLPALVALSLQTAVSQVVAPASEALVDRFLAVIPDAHVLQNPQWDLDTEQVERLTELNPERGEDIEAVREGYRRCTAPTAATVTLRLFRETARGLGEEKLGRLIAFYQSRDYAILGEIAGRNEGGETLSAADTAEAARITSAYPLTDYLESLSQSQSALFEDQELLDTLVRCEEELQTALASRSLRNE